jgi:hypothetical protein
MDADIGAVFQQVCGEGMAKGVDRNALADAGAEGGLAASGPERPVGYSISVGQLSCPAGRD